MKMWYANESDSRKRNGGAWAGEGYRQDRRENSGAGRVTKSSCKNPPTPGIGGDRSSAQGAEDFRVVVDV